MRKELSGKYNAAFLRRRMNARVTGLLNVLRRCEDSVGDAVGFADGTIGKQENSHASWNSKLNVVLLVVL